MQLERLANAVPAVRRREVVKQQQLTRTEQHAPLDRSQVKIPLSEVASLFSNRIELHTAQEASVTGARQSRRGIGCLD
jgi:hypothetical protein